MTDEHIRLMHGSGQGLHHLLSDVVLPALGINTEATLEDAAVIERPSGALAFTTDSFVVNPLSFNGGNIGKLAACGTINDLAMMGAVPKHMSVALIIEEGMPFSQLKEYLLSLKHTCDEAGVIIACGDTKVVDAGKGDGLFINTSGIGHIMPGISLSAANAKEGDAVIVSGPIGQHGIAMMTARNALGFASSVMSDCAPLHSLAERLLTAVPDTRVLRDATRGGCAAVLNEIADDSRVTIHLDQASIPIHSDVAAACDYLGLDPLQVANEGRFVAVVPGGKKDAALAALKDHPQGGESALIGQVKKRDRFGLVMSTEIGGVRMVDVPPGHLLPRIC